MTLKITSGAPVPLHPDQPVPVPNYVWKADLIRVVDGDTIEVRIDRGFKDSSVMTLRLAGIDAAERYTEKGKEATSYIHGLLSVHQNVHPDAGGGPLYVQTTKPDKYGDRYGAVVYAPDKAGRYFNVNEKMVAESQAVRYNGGKR